MSYYQRSSVLFDNRAKYLFSNTIVVQTQESTPNVPVYLFQFKSLFFILQCPATVLSLSDSRICRYAQLHASSDGCSSVISYDFSWKVEECGISYFHAERGKKFNLIYNWDRMTMNHI